MQSKIDLSPMKPIFQSDNERERLTRTDRLILVVTLTAYLAAILALLLQGPFS
ncbi:MAG: hypothetical protein GY798_26335 [Hyphomicrobiales bacterium]|nr:hypothetical protein [Hyphomicrobiales bacterium]